MASSVDTHDPSASKLASPAKTEGQNAPPTLRLNAVAYEVPVVATGARPAESGGQRELFTEETTTALVFESGGVLRLAAAVNIGQLLFLTHKQTKREVVAQVTRKRDFRPTSCYVEVEFTEPSPGFWGIEFAENAAADGVSPKHEEADELLQAGEDETPGEPAAPAVPPSAQEIAALKGQVDALREQLKLLQEQKEEAAAFAAETLKEAQAPKAPEVPSVTPGPIEATAQQENPIAAETAPAAPEPRALPRVKLPQARTDIPQGPSTEASTNGNDRSDLSQKPFSEIIQLIPEKKRRAAAVRKDVLFAAFVIVVIGAAWYENLLPLLPKPRDLFQKKSPSAAVRPTPTPQKAADIPKVASTATAPPNNPAAQPTVPSPLATPTATPVLASEAAKTSAGVNPATPAIAEKVVEEKAWPGETTVAKAAPEKPVVALPRAKHSSPASVSKASAVPVAPASSGAGFVPPKLIKAVRAVASPDLLEDFVVGNSDNVTIDAVVDASGHVKEMKPLSGPASLRSIAMGTLKQYQYEPATQHGKPVPAHITVKVKFVFER